MWRFARRAIRRTGVSSSTSSVICLPIGRRAIRYLSHCIQLPGVALSTKPQVKVLYVAGTGRTGSTLVANVLGQHPGYESLGEIRYLWERGMVEDRLCGCGVRFSECPLWTAVVSRAHSPQELDPGAIAAQHDDLLRVRRLPALWRAEPHAPTAPLKALVDRLGRLYSAIQSETGADVIVDASKLPTYALALDLVPGIDLRILHLVRDPRAVANSWSRIKPLADKGPRSMMLRQSTARSTLLWQTWNLAVSQRWGQKSDRYVMVRYEDFVERPRDELSRVLALLGGDVAQLPLHGDHAVTLEPTHSVAGNPSRLDHGSIVLRPDDRWIKEMSTVNRLESTVLSVLTRRQFGYPIW